jgi:hypothetical protein
LDRELEWSGLKLDQVKGQSRKLAAFIGQFIGAWFIYPETKANSFEEMPEKLGISGVRLKIGGLPY